VGKYKVSVNQLAEFDGASEASKKRIVSQQRKPDAFRIPWYQLPKARIKKCIAQNGDLSPIHEAIGILQARKPSSKRQANDRDVSIEALTRFVTIKLPSIIRKTEFEVIRPKSRSVSVKDVDIIVAPEIVVRGTVNGKTVIGGVKIHISKNNPFDLKKSKAVATVVYKYLKDEVANEDDTVIPDLCFCLDVFDGRLVAAPDRVDSILRDIRAVCEEFKSVWDQTA
jgi:hypothetical protein